MLSILGLGVILYTIRQSQTAAARARRFYRQLKQRPSQTLVMLEIALRNLVENVMRHTPAGTQAEIRVGSDADGTWIKVLDNGPAVQPELSKRAPCGYM